jgi:hypothetical protein
MTVYMLTVHTVEGQENYLSDEEMQAAFADTGAFNTRIQEQGAWVFGGGLHPADTATVVDGTKGPEPIVTDGPFAEAKEHIGGFWVVKVPDLDAAMKLAAEASVACRQPVEVRPFQDDTEC